MPSWTILDNSTLNNWKSTLSDAALNDSPAQQSLLVGQYYKYLSDNGHWYGNLAYQASQNTGFAGQLANNYMSAIAEKSGVVITSTSRQSIMVGLAIADVQNRIALGGNALPPDKIFNYHVVEFERAGLTASAWTGTVFEKYMSSGAWLLGMGPTDQNGDSFTVMNLNSFLRKIGENKSSAHTEFVDFLGAIWNDGVLLETFKNSTRESKLQFFDQVSSGISGSWRDFQPPLAVKVLLQGLIRDTWDDCFDSFDNFKSQPGTLTGAKMVEECLEASTLSKLGNKLFGIDTSFEVNQEFFRRYGEEPPSWFKYLSSADDDFKYTSLSLDSWIIENPMLLGVVTLRSIDDLAEVNEGVDFNNLQTGQILDLFYSNDSGDSLVDSYLSFITNPYVTFNQSGVASAIPNADNATLINNGVYLLTGIGNVNTLSGNYAYANDLLSNAFRPGSQSLTTHILGTSLAENFRANPELVNSVVWKPEVKAAALNYLGMGVQNAIPTDPLVLDLNGDGVRLTSFGEAPVLFDIDHDGGSKELTGWVSAEDGIVVMDLNSNGQIDGIHETMSEYFNGTAGTDGESGSKPFADGFAALKSLDSNGDNRFTSADTAWNNVKVWVDADHDGETDTGELRTFASLGITSINLLAAAQSGLINGGNEVLATGSFVMAGQTREAQAARFIANPAGNTSSAVVGGANVSSEDGQSTHVSALTTGATLDAAALGVANVYGNVGNDVLIGTAGANWLVGGQGSDSFDAGDGDDMLIIDAADLQQNIDAGGGFDMVQVVGSEGVTLNMAQAGVEVVAGGTGDDVFIGGGRSSVFVRADDGDDIVIGGAANDGLSGENGNDLIDGGAGNDVIRGGRGQDQLLGGSGDDLIEGGQDDDRLAGGDGNDVLKGQQGDDSLDGGEGTDMAEFSGSFADYRITRLSDTAWRVVDTKAGRDGADMLTNIEKLNFADVSAVDITLDNPFPVQDVITIADRSGPKLIKVADLLANDRDWQADTLRITTISDVIGGTVAGTYNATTKEWTPTLTAAGELTFTPTAGFTGVMSFKYKIADTDGTPGATAFQVGTSNAAEMRGQVFIKTPDMPIDSAFTEQWYLSDINLLPVKAMTGVIRKNQHRRNGECTNFSVASNDKVFTAKRMA